MSIIMIWKITGKTLLRFNRIIGIKGFCVVNLIEEMKIERLLILFIFHSWKKYSLKSKMAGHLRVKKVLN
jgi:hypothetical protein